MPLPPYKGSVLRGGFGSAFRRIACAVRAKTCDGCLVRAVCPYAYVFETAPPPDSTALRHLQDVPRPFVFEPPLDEKTQYEPGEHLEFGLVLIGRGLEYLPFFIAAFKELGRTGIGPRRAGFDLVKVEQCRPWAVDRLTLYDDTRGLVSPALRRNGWSIGAEEVRAVAEHLDPARLEIEFVTFTRLKAEDRLQPKPSFETFTRAALRRVSSLAYFHHGVTLELDYRSLVDCSREVRLASDRTRWVNWKRYSNRQDAAMDLGGLVGSAVYEGQLTPFHELLVVASLVHIGKNATFGLGKINISRQDSPLA
jgi:hypothetical protein